jgi:hypothetical protein
LFDDFAQNVPRFYSLKLVNCISTSISFPFSNWIAS